MESKRAFVVLSLWLFTGFGVTFASTLEEDYIKNRSWIPLETRTIKDHHEAWHPPNEKSGGYGREFL